MTAQITRWFEYGEPMGDRVTARVRTAYQTGPNEPAREDDIQHGTVGFGALELLNEEPFSEHLHDDGSLMLSGLPEDAEERLLASFKDRRMEEHMARYVAKGLSAAEALDYYMVEHSGYSQSSWARQRGVQQPAVSENVAKAREKLAEN